MTKEQLREETRQRLMEEDLELGRDDEEVERQMPDVHQRLIAEADMARDHYKRIAEEALTERYRDNYKRLAEKWDRRADALRDLKLS